MRIRIIFNLENRGASVPFNHQFLIDALIKSLISRTEYSDFNLYGFSGLKGQIVASKEGLEFYSNKVTLVISSPNADFLQFLIKSFFEKQKISIGNLHLTPCNVEKELPIPLESEMKYVCISPLAIVDPLSPNSKDFIKPSEDTFSDLLYESTMNRMESSEMFSPIEISTFNKFQLVPDIKYLSKIHQQGKKFSRIFRVIDQGKEIEIRGYTFPFTLYAAPPVQQFIYDSGLGVFTNLGIGMLDIVNTNFNLRTVEYKI